MKRTHSIRVPVTLAEQREAQQLAERLDTPIAPLVRKMLREKAQETPNRKRSP